MALLCHKIYSKKRCDAGLLEGFGILELAVAISVAATIAVGYLIWAQPTNLTSSEKTQQTRQQLLEIDKALLEFRVQNGRLPCPSDPTMRPDNSKRLSNGTILRHTDTPDVLGTTYPDDNFGRENFSVGTTGVICSTNVGAVPVLSLNLKQGDSYDAWGRQFTYHVADGICGDDTTSASATEADACTQKDYSDGTGNITVKDSASSTISTEEAYVLVSHGPDGTGAYLPSGKQLSGSTENSNGDTTYQKTTVSANNMDLLIFHTKAQIDSLTLDPISTTVSVDACNQNRLNLAKIINNDSNSASTNTSTKQFDDNISQFKVTNSSASVYNSGSELALNMLWAVQMICIEYFGNTADPTTGWNGPTCPGGTWDANAADFVDGVMSNGSSIPNPGAYIGGGTFNTDNNTCICASGTWDGSC